uniref:Uncharacterized protein n=1 Tax=Nomascus leucogenys TaxID=61853 RepID=G1QYJ1_NOMLE
MPWEGVRTQKPTRPATAATHPGTWAAPSFSQGPSSLPSAMAMWPCAQMLGASSASFMRWWGFRCLGSYWQGSGTGWAPPCAMASVTLKPSSCDAYHRGLRRLRGRRGPQAGLPSLSAAGVVLDPARPGLLRLSAHHHRELAASSVPPHSGRGRRPRVGTVPAHCDPASRKGTKISPAWWCVPVVPATREAEMGGSLESPPPQSPQEARAAPRPRASPRQRRAGVGAGSLGFVFALPGMPGLFDQRALFPRD